MGEGEARPRALRVGQAAALGLVQGPTELLPVSSSAHLRIVPWLAGWDLDGISAEDRKAFDVAVHGGAALALLIGQRALIADELRRLDGRRVCVIALSFLPAVAIGLALEETIDERLGGPRATAAGLLAGSVAMCLADRAPRERAAGDARPLDGLVIGFAQAAALAPGVSRNGSTLAAARWRRFGRAQANLLSRTVALPVITAAVARKGSKLLGRWRRGRRGRGRISGAAAAADAGAPAGTMPGGRDGNPRDLALPLAAGVGAAFASTLASQGLIRVIERDRALWPYAAYRVALAGLILLRGRS